MLGEYGTNFGTALDEDEKLLIFRWLHGTLHPAYRKDRSRTFDDHWRVMRVFSRTLV
jgi:hypothetical protein